MKEAFEKILKELYNAGACDASCDYDKGYDHAISEAINIVQEVSEEYKEGWIPCSERLPEEETYILLSFDNFSLPCVGRFYAGCFYIGDEDDTCLSQDLFVNAWQPLPEHYKE